MQNTNNNSENAFFVNNFERNLVISEKSSNFACFFGLGKNASYLALKQKIILSLTL